MASRNRRQGRGRWPIALLAVTSLVAVVGLIAWQDRGIDIPGIEDDAIPFVGEESRPPYERPSKEEMAAYLEATPVPKAKRFKVGKLTPDSRQIQLRTAGGYCVGAKRATIARIDHFDIERSESAITITMFVTHRRNFEFCAGVGGDLVGIAHLGEPLGDRIVLDGSKDPPTEPPRSRFPFPRWDEERPAS